MSQFGNFHDFCRDSTLPVCNIFAQNGLQFDGGIEKSCELKGFAAGDRNIRNLGTVLLCAVALIVTAILYWRSERKKAAVGRREMQVLLCAYALVSMTEMFSVGGFLQDRNVLVWFSAIHIGAIAATFWTLLINAIVGYQLMDDGTVLSVGLTIFSAVCVFLGVAYIGVDSGINYTGEFVVQNRAELKNYALYVCYLLFPLLASVAFFVLEAMLCVKVLKETRPLVLLTISGFLFLISQIFQFVASVHICHATAGKVDGAIFETFTVLLAVVTLWFFWSSITEDEWPDDPMNSTIQSEQAYA
ncbi:chitin synthase III catalytic subunit [Pyronema omphalodes]|nr:chitin synthase III catalytic subunit [Pyronema omphalodes]